MAIIEPINKTPDVVDGSFIYTYQVPKGSRVVITAQADNGYRMSSMLVYEGTDEGISSGVRPYHTTNPHTFSSYDKKNSVYTFFDGDGPINHEYDEDVSSGHEVRILSSDSESSNLKIIVETFDEYISYVLYTTVRYNELFNPTELIRPYERILGRTVPLNEKYNDRTYSRFNGTYGYGLNGEHLLSLNEDRRAPMSVVYFDATSWPTTFGG